MELKVITKNGETILPITFYGKNRNLNVLGAQKRVFEHFNIPINYIEWPFDKAGHGDAIQYFINQCLPNKFPDYFLFIDLDAIPLRKDIIDIIYNKISDKNTVFGPAWTSNHRSPNHIHAACCFLAFSKDLYVKLGCPPMHDRIPRSDNGEELSFKASELGYCISLVYPNNYYELTEEEMKETGNPKYWNLGQRLKWGLCSQYSDLIFHAGMMNIKRGNEIFIKKCDEIIKSNLENQKIEAIIVSNNYGDYLELSLKENVKYFDNIIVVTSEQDSKTQDICKKYTNVNCYIYDGWNKNNAKFNFGGARNFGTQFLKYNDWVVFLDSDIVIKEDFSGKLTDINKFYGSYRRFIPKLENYQRLNTINSATWDREKENYERIEGSGCGFFQVIHFNRLKSFYIKNNYIYPDSYSAEQVDIDFLKQFCKFDGQNYENLVRLNIETWHLGMHGINNSGRSEKDIFFNL